MKTFKHFDGREIPIKEIFKETTSKYHDFSKFQVGQKVKITLPFGGYNNTPEHKIGTITEIGIKENGMHRFTSEFLEVFTSLYMRVENENGYAHYGLNYPYPIQALESDEVAV